MQTAGIIFDIYDDPKALLLRPQFSGLPDHVKTASLMDPSDLEALPDRLFALVAQNGDNTLRKYAMHDEAHLATSVIYFMKTSHLLPEDARKIAANNLVEACSWYDIEPPGALKKVAEGYKDYLFGRAARRADTAEKGLQYLRDMLEEGKQEKHKSADLTNTEVMPVGVHDTSMRTDTSKPVPGVKKTKTSGWQHAGDLTHTSAPQRVKKASYSKYALDGRYPLDSYQHVKQAEAYFNEHHTAFSPEERRTFAMNLAERANEIGVKVAGAVNLYSGTEYGPFIASELQARIRNFEGTPKTASYEVLLDKLAQISPKTMVEALRDADEKTGAAEAYGKPFTGFRDPYQAVFGRPKEAGDAEKEIPEKYKLWSWNEGSDYVNAEMLYDVASNAYPLIEIALNEDAMKDFRKDPIPFFEALPDDRKHIIARVCSDNSGGSYRGS